MKPLQPTFSGGSPFFTSLLTCFIALGSPFLLLADDPNTETTSHKEETQQKETPKQSKLVSDQKGTKKTEKKPTKTRFAQIDLAEAMPESPGMSGPFAENRVDLRKTIARFERAAKDDSIEGVILNLHNPPLGRGTINELRAAIHRLRDANKKVFAQLEMATPGDYLVACACDEIVMPESGLILLPGIHAEAIFYKGLLSKIGVKADFIHMGEAKGAAESLTRKKWSPAVKKNVTAMVDDLYVQMIETIALDRPVTEQAARDAIDIALLTAEEAHRRKLIDRVAYRDELRESLASAYPTDKLVYVQDYGKKRVDADFSGPAGFFKLIQLMTGGKASRKAKGAKKIAIVYAVGPIMTGKSESGLFGGQTVGSTTLVAALDKANRDDQVKAIVLRVNSPGGSAIASDLIWRKIQQIEKPVVASMGDVAGSGGYYIAMGADAIFAEPGTVTGSIGVVGGKFAFQGMYDHLGMTTDLIARGKNSGLFSQIRKFNESERTAIMRMMEQTYEQFTAKAAEGRSMPLEKLLPLAGGRVYTGRQAKKNGLIDELGTLNDALAKAKSLAGLDPNQEIKVQTLPSPKPFFEELFGSPDSEKEVTLRLESLALPSAIQAQLRRVYSLQRVMQQSPVALVMPVDIVME